MGSQEGWNITVPMVRTGLTANSNQAVSMTLSTTSGRTRVQTTAKLARVLTRFQFQPDPEETHSIFLQLHNRFFSQTGS